MKNVNELLLEKYLREIDDIIYNQIGVKGRFEDLDKSIKIIEQRNSNYYPSICKKMKNLTRLIYETGIVYSNKDKANKINQILDEIYLLFM